MKNIDLLSKYQAYFLGLAIFFSLSAVSFINTKGETKLLLHNYPTLMFLLVSLSIILALVYINIDKIRIKNLSNQIKEIPIEKKDDFNTLLLELTGRQKEVYELIMAGKTNKEIMSDLFIEQSTLKSHINQIYKKLNIKNRKELKSKKRD